MRYSVRSALIGGRDDTTFLIDDAHLAVIHMKGLSGNAVRLYHFYLGIVPGVLIDDDFVAKTMSLTKPTLIKLRNELKDRGLLRKERKVNEIGQSFVYLAPTRGMTIDQVVEFWEAQDEPYLRFTKGEL